jgi:aspartate aminotransferase
MTLNKQVSSSRQLSKRILQIQPSPTLVLNSKANNLKKQGHKILNFAVGEPDYPTAGIVVEKAIESLRKGRTKYTSAGGSIELREAIAQKLTRDNQMSYTADDIVCGIGAKEVLFHSFMSLLNDGDEVLLTAPCWVSYCDQIKGCGAVPVVVPFDKKQWHKDKVPFTLDQLEKHASEKTKIFVLNSPNNPSGYVLSRAQLEELGAYLRKKDWWIISDEIYEYMAFDRPHLSLVQVCPDLKDRFLLIHGFSKGFAMTGWRVGYMAGPKSVTPTVRALQSQSSTCLPAFIEDAATLAMSFGSKLMEKDVEKLKVRREIAIDAMNRLGGFEYIRPEGAYYILIDVEKYLKPGESTIAFSEMLLEKFHLAMAPGEAFGVPGWIRLSYATDEQTIRAGIERLNEAFISRRT